MRKVCVAFVKIIDGANKLIYNKMNKKEKRGASMSKKNLKSKIIASVIAVILITAGVLAIVYFAGQKPSTTQLEASVARASLSSHLSSSGVVDDVNANYDIPLAAMTIEEPQRLSEIMKNDYTLNLITLLQAGDAGPILYRVIETNEDYVAKTATFTTEQASQHIVTLAPVYFDWDAATKAYGVEMALGSTEAENVKEYVLSLLLREGVSSVDPSAFPDAFWMTDEENKVEIKTGKLSDMLKKEISYAEDLEFTVSNFVWREGDLLMLDNRLFTLSFREMFVTFALSEYDVADIHKRMRNDERVYAAVGINALGGRKLLAEIIEIKAGSNSSGVSYFTLVSRLVFPEITKNEDGSEVGSYLYYDDFLSDQTVKYLGINLSENVEKEDLLDNYSVTVSAQKTVIDDTLIVPTKCIYYDDAKKPYVIILQGEEKKEKRVYIKIMLSTGTDAAVTADEGYTLNEGDVMRYTADATLIGSLF